MPSLSALRCFEVAAQWQNFTQAAQALHLTHGAISRAVRMLEDDLGVALFERRSRRVFLTPAGEQLAQAVREGMALMQQACHALRTPASTQRHWVLSCEPTLLMRWLIPRWPDFQAQHPQWQIHWVAGGGSFSFAQGIDLAIRRNDFDWPAGSHVTRLFAEKMGPVCRPDKVAQWWQAQPQGPVLSPQAPRLHTRTRPQAWAQWCEAVGQPVATAPSTQQHTFEHFYLSLQAAVAGLGVAMGSYHLVRDELAAGLLAAPAGFVEDGSHYCLLAPAQQAPGSPHAALLEWLRRQA